MEANRGGKPVLAPSAQTCVAGGVHPPVVPCVKGRACRHKRKLTRSVLFCYRKPLGRAERRQPGCGPPGSHLVLPVFASTLPDGWRHQQCPPHQRTRPPAYHPLLGIYGSGCNVYTLLEQSWIEAHSISVNHKPTSLPLFVSQRRIQVTLAPSPK